MEEKTYENEELKYKRYGLGVRHLQIACMCASGLSLFVVRSGMGVAILAMTDHTKPDDPNIYPWDKQIQGLILSSFFWGYTLMQIPAGLLANRFGGKPILLVALLANGTLCLALPAIAKWGGWPSVCAVRVGIGLTQACLIPSMHTLLGRWLPATERTTYSGFVYGANNLGVIISMPMCGVLSQTALGWRSIFYATAALSYLTAVIWWWFAASSPGEHRMMSNEEREYIEKDIVGAGAKRTLRAPWSGIFTCKGFWAIAFGQAALATCYTCFFVDLPTYLEKGMHISLKNSASLSALPYIGMLLGTVVSTFICDKLVNNGYMSLGACRKLFSSISLCGAGAALVPLMFIDVDHSALAVLVLVTYLTLVSFCAAGFLINHLDLSPNFGGVIMAVTNCFANVGSIVAPIITSLILKNDPTDLSRWRIVFGCLTSLCVFCNVIYLCFSTVKRQPWDDPAYSNKNARHTDELQSVLKTKNVEE